MNKEGLVQFNGCISHPLSMVVQWIRAEPLFPLEFTIFTQLIFIIYYLKSVRGHSNDMEIIVSRAKNAELWILCHIKIN